MRKPTSKIVRTLIALAVLALTACATPHRAVPSYSPLILISIDGYRADYLERGLSPQLAALAADGVRAQALKPAFPTLTFPNHYTIVTGLYPDHHGIVANRMIDPASGKRFAHGDTKLAADPLWWTVDPLWVSVERQGKHAATMFWPGSDVEIGGVRPDYWAPFDASASLNGRVDQVLLWLGLPASRRPDFVTLYFEQVDHAGHEYGPDSAQLDAALRDVDAALGRLVQGLRRRGLERTANLVIVSDHGMAATDVTRTVLLDDVIDVSKVDLVNTGVLTGLAAKTGHATEVERALLAPQAHMTCRRKGDMPARLHYGTNARIPPLLCLADDGWTISTRRDLERPGHEVQKGEHGYDNDDPQMRAMFVAHGPAFRHGLVVPEFDNVDIYVLLTSILHLEPQPNDGDYGVVAPMLVPVQR
jgi:predicted AlkP superfamily pyrophosphatase or phosphodiesterase